MKKLVCLAIVLALCLSSTALAKPLPSKTVVDLTRFKVNAENQPNDDDMYLLPFSELLVGEGMEEYQELLDICQTEIDKLASAPNIEEYFGEVKDSEDNVVDMRERLDAQDEPLNVFEFCPVIAGGLNEDCGKVTATMLFATPYEKDERVLVLIGIVTVNDDETQTVEWTEFDATVLEPVEDQVETYGCIQVEFDQETALEIQNKTALLAIVSK